MKKSFLIKYIGLCYFICACTMFCASSVLFCSNAVPAKIPVYIIEHGQQKCVPKKHVLVVFIHGTIIPWIPNIYAYQPFGCDGLHDISYDPKYIRSHQAAFVSALLYERMCDFIVSDVETSYSFCTFSWNGRLSARQRARSADNLYHALIQKIKDLRAKHNDKDVEVYAFGHSHGGNVLLNLPASEQKFGKNLIIDKAVLLGTPVQSKTEKFVYSPIFKDVYSFFSYGDWVQVLDVMSSPDASSRRRFDSYKKLCGDKKNNNKNSNNDMGPHVKQISIKIDGISPRHNELWCFGGDGNYMYRDDLLISPLPVFIFMPIILDFIDRYMGSATLMQLKINQQKTSYRLSCTDRRKFPRKYKDCYCTVGFDDIMGDFLGDSMVPEFRAAFHLVGLDLN
ncbi:MAG: hypothetical protein ABH827_05240 [bacterium]